MLNSFGLNCIQSVLCVFQLDFGFLSVGWLLFDGYSLVFEYSTCYMFKDKSKEILFASVPMTKNKIFLYALTSNEKYAMKTILTNDTWLWYHRYNHLIFKKLTLKTPNRDEPLPVFYFVRLFHRCVHCFIFYRLTEKKLLTVKVSWQSRYIRKLHR